MTAEADYLLAQKAALRRGLRRAGQLVRRRAQMLVPAPGYPGDKPELAALRDSIIVGSRESRSGEEYAVVGPRWPQGAHGHLVEGASKKRGIITVRHHSHGEPTGAILRRQPFLFAAAAQLADQQTQQVVAELRKVQPRKLGGELVTVNHRV